MNEPRSTARNSLSSPAPSIQVVEAHKPLRCRFNFHKWYISDVCYAQMRKAPLNSSEGMVISCRLCGALNPKTVIDPSHPDCCPNAAHVRNIAAVYNPMLLSSWQRW